MFIIACTPADFNKPFNAPSICAYGCFNSYSAWWSTLKTLNHFFGQTLMNYVTASAIQKCRGKPVVIIGRLGDFNYEEWAPLKCN